MKFAGVYIRRREGRAVVFDENKKRVYEKVAAGANYHSVKKEGIVTLLHNLLEEIKDIDCICIGVAGCDRDKDMNELRGELVQHFKDCIVYNNGVIALVGASGRSLGSEDAVLVEADTGAVAFGANRKGEIMRAGGWGYILGDEGGAFDIGKRALTHAARAYDELENNNLVEEITRFLSIDEFSDVIDLYNVKDPVQYVAKLFPMVCRLAEKGDGTAKAILEESAGALAASIKKLSERLDMEDEKALYAVGRVFEEPEYKKRFEKKAEGFSIKTPRYMPEVGAAMLAFEKLTGRFEELE